MQLQSYRPPAPIAFAPVTKLTVDRFPLPIGHLFDEFGQYQNLFFFYPGALMGVIETAFRIYMRTDLMYQPPTYYDFDGLMAEVMREFEIFSMRQPDDYCVHQSVLDTIELVVEMLEVEVDRLVQERLPMSRYEASNLHWLDGQLFVRLRFS